MKIIIDTEIGTMRRTDIKALFIALMPKIEAMLYLEHEGDEECVQTVKKKMDDIRQIFGAI